MTSWLPRAEAAAELVAATELLFEAGVMSPSGHGNLSARLSDETILLTSQGSIRRLDPATLAVVDLDGTVREGAVSPENAEIISMHTQVYRARPSLGAIIHTHSPHLTAFAYAHEPLPIRSEPMLRFGQAVAVPVAAWAPRGSEASVEAIVEAVSSSPQTSAVLLANHGVLAFSSSPIAAARLIVALEEAATEELAAAAIGGAKDFPPDALEQVRASMARVR